MTESTSWLRPGPAGDPGLPRLLCLPYSGKGASLFRDWPAALDGVAEVAAVQLPGREDRLAEPPVTEPATLLAGLLPAVEGWWREPLVVFAHCMGAVLAAELLPALHEHCGRQPDAVVLSGAAPAWCQESGYDLSDLSDAALVRSLREQGALTPQLLAEPALLALMLPAARADATLSERIRERGRPESPPLSCPLWLFGVSDDPRCAPADLHDWAALTSGPVTLRQFDGDHDYVDAAPAPVIDAVREVLAGVEVASR